MVPKFTGTAYFAATEKGAKEAVAELKGKGADIDFLYTGPSAANTDEQISMIDDLVAQRPDGIAYQLLLGTAPQANDRRINEGRCRWQASLSI
jgi:ABC-type sugar transport system substrate-binding protein